MIERKPATSKGVASNRGPVIGVVVEVPDSVNRIVQNLTEISFRSTFLTLATGQSASGKEPTCFHLLKKSLNG
jgi:hypothetical protein